MIANVFEYGNNKFIQRVFAIVPDKLHKKITFIYQVHVFKDVDRITPEKSNRFKFSHAEAIEQCNFKLIAKIRIFEFSLNNRTDLFMVTSLDVGAGLDAKNIPHVWFDTLACLIDDDRVV